jgi:serine protease Do
MNNKVVTSILIILVILTAGSVFYSIVLGRQINNLDERLDSFESEQTARITKIGDDLASFRSQTETGLSILGNKLTDASRDITVVKSDLSASATRLSDAEQAIGGVSSNLTALDKRVAGAESGISGLSSSLIDTVSIYRQAVKATVRITDGQSLGSGFIYDVNRHIITAYHVVNGLSPIYVMMYDGRVSQANVIGFCPYSDIAVLRVDAISSAGPLLMADSSQIHIGESVIAIGSPFSLDNRDSATLGVISQLNRFVDVENVYKANFIQFDAAVNPGNSGGPLLNSDGKVIGIVDARIAANEGDGISWAISSNKAKRVADSIIATGSFAYPWIGTGISDITPQNVKDKGLDTANGVIVGSVTNGGPASAAGIQTGDIIVSMDNIPMRNIADLTSYLGEFKSPGDAAILEVIRGSSKLKLTVTVGTRT